MKENYNKEEVMKTFKELFPYITNEDVIAAPNKENDSRSGDILTILMRSEAKKLNTFLSTALDQAYKAGRESIQNKIRDLMEDGSIIADEIIEEALK